MSNTVFAGKCNLDTDSFYFQDLKGEIKFFPKTRTRTTVYPKYTSFTPSYPTNVSLNIPLSGDCDKFSLSKIKI